MGGYRFYSFVGFGWVRFCVWDELVDGWGDSVICFCFTCVSFFIRLVYVCFYGNDRGVRVSVNFIYEGFWSFVCISCYYFLVMEVFWRILE